MASSDGLSEGSDIVGDLMPAPDLKSQLSQQISRKKSTIQKFGRPPTRMSSMPNVKVA